MRLFLFLFLYSLSALAQTDCYTSNNDITGGGNFSCLNLYIDNNLLVVTDPNPIIINVSGEVIISANITIDGGAGVNLNGAHANGPDGGPGGGQAGGRNFGPAQAGQDNDFPLSTSNGQAVDNTSLVCGHGGSGGGFYLAGADGKECTGSADPKAIGGTSVIGAEFNFTLAAFRGGFGGGAGDTSTADELGTGGGGGGGLYIKAIGNITIHSGVTISARGGAGGSALVDGGGGGGGSGGAVWLQTNGVILNSGTIDVRGGVGGNSAIDGHGGNGGDGVYRLESSTGLIVDSGLRLPAAPVPSSSSVTAQSFTSDISCGSVKTNSNQNAAQIFLGFMLVSGLAWFFKRRRSL